MRSTSPPRSCIHCGQPQASDQKFCQKCGSPAAATHAILDYMSPTVREAFTRLSREQQNQYLDEWERKLKNSGVAYLLWFVALHYLYLNKIGTQIIFWLTLGGLLVWWVADLFRISRMVKDYNMDAATDVMVKLRAIWA